MAAAAAGSLVLTWLRDGIGHADQGDLLALVATVTTTTAVNLVAFVGVLRLTGDQPLRGVLAAVRT